MLGNSKPVYGRKGHIMKEKVCVIRFDDDNLITLGTVFGLKALKSGYIEIQWYNNYKDALKHIRSISKYLLIEKPHLQYGIVETTEYQEDNFLGGFENIDDALKARDEIIKEMNGKPILL